MKLTEKNTGLKGIWQWTSYRGDIITDNRGNILNEVVEKSPQMENMIVTVGKNLTLDRLFGLSSAVALTSVGVGTDSTAAAVGQTQLNPTVAGTVVIQTADAGTARDSQTVTMLATFATGTANFVWRELGLFNGNVNGTSVMFNRIVVGAITKDSTISIVLTVQITQS